MVECSISFLSAIFFLTFLVHITSPIVNHERIACYTNIYCTSSACDTNIYCTNHLYSDQVECQICLPLSEFSNVTLFVIPFIGVGNGGQGGMAPPLFRPSPYSLHGSKVTRKMWHPHSQSPSYTSAFTKLSLFTAH